MLLGTFGDKFDFTLDGARVHCGIYGAVAEICE